MRYRDALAARDAAFVEDVALFAAAARRNPYFVAWWAENAAEFGPEVRELVDGAK